MKTAAFGCRALVAGLVFVTAGGWLAAGRAADTSASRPKVAMMDFTTDDGLLRSAAGAAQWSALTQDALARTEPDLDWIERAQLHLAADELNLSAGGFTSAEGSLRVGKWLKADLAILGSFTRNGRDDDGHTLRLEIVDLARADTLATRTIPLDGDRRAAIAPDPALIPSTAAALREALAEAREKLARTARQKVVAPLFFHNADPSPRLNGFEDDLLATLTEAAGHTADVRILRFPKAEAARGESELALLGLAESDAEAWQRVADLYVWGSYHETPAAEAAFTATPVEVEWTLWDGVNPPRHRKDRATVAQLPTLARRLADQCLAAARQVPAVRSANPMAARGEIARSLVEQGEQLGTTLAGRGVTERAAFLNTPEGRRLTRQRRSLLEAACFFTPTDRDAQFARLQARWDGFPFLVQRLPLLDLWQRSNDLADYVRRFGGSAPALARTNVDADAYLLKWLRYGENQVHVSGSEPNLPVDATDANIAAWHAALDARFVRDTIAYTQMVVAAKPAPPPDAATASSYATWLQTALGLTHDRAGAAHIVETVWPLYQPFYRLKAAQEDQRYDLRGGLFPAVQQLYTELHQPERARLSSGRCPRRPPWRAQHPPAWPPTLRPPPRPPGFRR